MAFRALSGDVRFKAKLRKRDKRAVYGGTNLLHRPEYQDLDLAPSGRPSYEAVFRGPTLV